MADIWNKLLKERDARVHIDDPDVSSFISAHLSLRCKKLISKRKHVVAVCVGTDRSLGDSLGPLIGTFLQENTNRRFEVLGTLEDPVHASNLENTLKIIEREYRNSLVIGIDACLGRMESVGNIVIASDPLVPGAGVNKTLPKIGHMSVTGIVNVGGLLEYYVLQNTRLNLILKMARAMSKGIYEGIHKVV